MENSYGPLEGPMATSHMTHSRYKLFILDSHELTRIGLRYSFQNNPSYQIVAEMDNVQDAVPSIENSKADVLILGLVPLEQALQLAKEVKTVLPFIKIVLFTAEQDHHNIPEALSAGINAYCLKTITSERLFQVLDAINQDAIWLDPGIAKRAAQSYVSPPPNFQGNLNYGHLQSSLTQREAEVLALLTEGNSNKEIAQILGISTHTVKTHVRNLIQKMAVEDRTQAVVKALHCGLVKHKGAPDSSMMEV